MIIAIDPGLSGGIAWLDGDQYKCVPMPGTPLDIFMFMAGLALPNPAAWKCIIENVGFHVQGNSASSSVKFARHCGHLDMALVALGIPTVKVGPSAWMKSLLGTVPAEKTARKNAIKTTVQQRLPYLGRAVTLQTADALGMLLVNQHQHRART
jgi:Holliday junction resolvasome RuvABC endonuclease subunit